MYRQLATFCLILFGGLFLLGQAGSALFDMAAGDVAPQDQAAPPQPLPGPSAAALAPDSQGHFRAQAMVNGQVVAMIVDTGATVVVLTEADARLAGLSLGPSSFTGSATTAAGTVRVAPVTLDRLAVGGIERRRIAAVVAQGTSLPASLLGQSYLSQLGEVRIAGGQMMLSN